MAFRPNGDLLVAAVIILLLGFPNLEIIPLLIFVILLMLAPILASLWVWLKLQDRQYES